MTDTPPFDLDSVLGRLGHDRELFADLARFFLEDGPSILQQIRDASEAKDAARLQQAAHLIKGMLANLGAEPARHAAEQLEREASEGKLSEATTTLEELSRQIDRLQQALRSYC